MHPTVPWQSRQLSRGTVVLVREMSNLPVLATFQLTGKGTKFLKTEIRSTGNLSFYSNILIIHQGWQNLGISPCFEQ